MSVKTQYNPNILNLDNNGRYDSDAGLTVANSSGIKLMENVSKYQMLSRMHKMEALNARLEDLIEVRAKELSEIAATNSKFVSIIAHDLRSPFCSILGALELLKEEMSQHHIHDIDNYISIATNSATKTLNLLDNLLEWTISQNEEKTFTPVSINLQDLFANEIDSVNISLSQKNIKIAHDTLRNLNVYADLQMVKTIIRNLLSNAIKYTNTDGEISLKATECKPFVEITVKDNGIGISSEAKQNLFRMEAFHSTAGTNNEKGTGLGLLLCKEFVERHGGNIWVESEPYNGCEFKFTLPALA